MLGESKSFIKSIMFPKREIYYQPRSKIQQRARLPSRAGAPVTYPRAYAREDFYDVYFLRTPVKIPL